MLLLAVAVSVVALTAAQAGSITHSTTYPSSGWANVSWGPILTVTLPKYNGPNTLLAVDLKLTGYSAVYGSAKNEALVTQTIGIRAQGHLTATDPTGYGFNAFFITEQTGLAVPGETLTFLRAEGDPVEKNRHYIGGAMANFMGSGDFAISPVESLGDASVFGQGGSVSGSSIGETKAQFDVTYTWSDNPPGTPELGTFALLGMSMLPMAGVAIRRRRKSA